MHTIKSLGKRCVLFVLEQLVHWRLKKIQPEIIGITGSVGKTSTKDAIYVALKDRVPTHASKGSYNTEFGSLLAILEQKSGYSSPLKWGWAILKGAWSTLMLESPPYEKLVLEMGADKPGDIEYLVKRLPPNVGIFANVKAMHLAEGQFEDLDAIFKEKSKLIRALPEEGWAILNADDKRVESLGEEVRAHVITFGSSTKADLRATQIRSAADGLHFVLNYDAQAHELHFPNLLGRHQIYVLLPAFAVGFLMGLSFENLYESLKTYAPPPGRMNRIEGIHGSTIIDSSYNASPEAMVAALDVLGSIPGRKIAALGSINELGKSSEHEHRRVGKHIPAVADMLVTVGKDARLYAESARESGFSDDKIHSFDTSIAAAEFLKDKVKKSDVILAKGSQNNVRMEHLVKALMKDPEKAPDLLVRQNNYWLARP